MNRSAVPNPDLIRADAALRVPVRDPDAAAPVPVAGDVAAPAAPKKTRTKKKRKGAKAPAAPPPDLPPCA